MLVFPAYQNVEPEEIRADEPKNKGSDDSDDSDESDDDKDKEKGLSNKKKKVSSLLLNTT